MASQRTHSVQADAGELYAALDLGTNNCRLLVAKPYFAKNTAKKSLKVVDSYSRIVRLGEGVSDTGMLSEEAMKRTLKALEACKKKLGRHFCKNTCPYFLDLFHYG